MTESRPAQILLEICDLVDSEMAAGATDLPGQSFFADELRAIQQPERRNLLEDYICESMIALLLGVTDQARSLALCLDTPGLAISPYMLVRGLIEYSYKITYVADPTIDSQERIRRALRLFVTDFREYEKMLGKSRSDVAYVAYREASNAKEIAVSWYRELTGKEIKTTTPKAIMDSVWKAGTSLLLQQAPDVNVVYEKGYRTGSVISHGNTWAIRHFCLETSLVERRKSFTVGLPESTSYGMLLLAAHFLQMSFGTVGQFGSRLPASAMNGMGKRIDKLMTLRATSQPN